MSYGLSRPPSVPGDSCPTFPRVIEPRFVYAGISGPEWGRALQHARLEGQVGDGDFELVLYRAGSRTPRRGHRRLFFAGLQEVVQDVEDRQERGWIVLGCVSDECAQRRRTAPSLLEHLPPGVVDTRPVKAKDAYRKAGISRHSPYIVHSAIVLYQAST